MSRTDGRLPGSAQGNQEISEEMLCLRIESVYRFIKYAS